MLRKILTLFSVVLLSVVLLSVSCTKNKTVDTSTVPTLDINRYLGTWYEIARFQHSFEKDLVGVTATYKYRQDGKIMVVNAGWKDRLEGEYDAAGGVVKVPNPSEPGRLKVSFFLFFYSDYNVMELDTINYKYALVGSSSPNYLWILAKRPQLDSSIYDMLVQKAKERGYDVSKLYKVPQPHY